jgi:hypothetical protein
MDHQLRTFSNSLFVEPAWILPAFRLISEMDRQLRTFPNDFFMEPAWILPAFNLDSVPKWISSYVPA